MLKVHVNDGRTLEVDLLDEAQYDEWTRRFTDSDFQDSITGLTVVQKGVQYSLPRPDGFRSVAFAAEPVNAGKGGVRLLCFADETRISMVVHAGQRASRVSVSRIGKRRFNPREVG